MKFVVGCDLEEFKKYYKRSGRGDLGATEEYIINQDSSSLIVWQEHDMIIGHAIWHETSTDEHRKGDSRDKEDRELLEKLLGGKKDRFVELHEVWLMEEYRGNGYGKRFFEFFEGFIVSKGYDTVIYYADHPAALAICRQRGYKEGYLEKMAWHVFALPLKRKPAPC